MDYDALQPGNIFTSEGVKWAFVDFKSYGGGQLDAFIHELGDYQITLGSASDDIILYVENPDYYVGRYGEPPAKWHSDDYLGKVKKLSSWNYHRVIITYIDKTGFCFESHDESRRVLKDGDFRSTESEMWNAEPYTEAELDYFAEIRRKLYEQDTVDTIPFEWLGRVDNFHLQHQYRRAPNFKNIKAEQ